MPDMCRAAPDMLPDMRRQESEYSTHLPDMPDMPDILSRGWQKVAGCVHLSPFFLLKKRETPLLYICRACRADGDKHSLD
jgi:hypothetical protein